MENKFIKIFFLLLILCIGFLIINPLLNKKSFNTKIVFFGMGKGDSIFIENNSKKILIDTGEKEQKNRLIQKLKALKVKEIDYLILTHPDKDHIGGASYIMETFKIGKVIQSSLEKDNKAQKRIDKVIKEKNIKNIRLDSDYEFTLGDLKCTIYAPKNDSYKKDNDYSLLTLIEDKKLHYFFAGDAEETLLKEVINIDLPIIDLYKVPHHGRANKLSAAIIKKISPRFAIITNCKGDQEVVETLKSKKAKILYAFQKDIHFLSNGKKLEIH